MIDLGPFQELARISFPQGLTLIKLEDVGECTVADFSDTFSLNCDCADHPDDCASFNVTGYFNAFSWELSAPLISCAQVGYIIEGRTSGKTVECGGLELADVYGLDCETDNCWLSKGSGKWAGNNWWGTWVGSVFDRWDGEINVITPAALGFTSSERINLWLGQAELTITSITQFLSTVIEVVTAEPHKLVTDADVEISGTENYDGLHTVNASGGTYIVYINVAYVADESAGKLIPRYDQ